MKPGQFRIVTDYPAALSNWLPRPLPVERVPNAIWPTLVSPHIAYTITQLEMPYHQDPATGRSMGNLVPDEKHPLPAGYRIISTSYPVYWSKS